MFSGKGHAYWLSTTTDSYDEQHVQLPCVHNRNPDNNMEATTSHVESRRKEHSTVLYTLKYLLLTSLLTAIEFSLGGSSPYTSADKTNKNKYT